MKLNKFWFGFLMCLSLMIILLSFYAGMSSRECNAIGGEIFTLTLPFLIVKWRTYTINDLKRKGR